MKIVVSLLIGLGLLAAGAAAALVQSLRMDRNQGPREAPTVEIAVAARDLRAMRVVEMNDVQMEKTSVKDLPAGHFTSAVAVIGKILAVTLVHGQAFTESRFLAEGSPESTAAAIPMGKRAFTIYVSSRNISGGIIYPGCMVDVLATFNLRNSSRGEAIATALLQKIQVFAVDRTSVVRAADQADIGKSQPSDISKVTLLIDPAQAEALQLAADRGSVALTFRNPADEEVQMRNGTVYNQGFVDRYGRPIDLAKLLEEAPPSQGERYSVAAPPAPGTTSDPAAPAATPGQPEPAFKRAPAMTVRVIRGSKVEEMAVEEKTAGGEE
jgi:pilus assembly protein CpaB